MFSSEEEASKVLGSERNILNSLDVGSFPLPDLGIVQVPVPITEEHDEDALTKKQNTSTPMVTEEGGVEVSHFDPAPLEVGSELKLNRLIKVALRSDPAGRHVGIRNRTDDENAAIAVVSRLTGQREVSDLFGVTQPQISHLTRSATSPQMDAAGRERPQLRQKIEQLGGMVVDKAFGVIADCLNNLTEERIKAVKTPQIAKIARDMSSLVRNVTPRDANDGPGVHFHIWRPDMAEESDYGEVINVRPVEKPL